jgi:hypothetical protein
MTKNAPVPDSLAVSQLCLNTPALGLEASSRSASARVMSSGTRAWLKTNNPHFERR